MREQTPCRSRQNEAPSCTSQGVTFQEVLSLQPRSKAICCHAPPISLGCLEPQQIMWPSRSSLPRQHSPARCVCVSQGWFQRSSSVTPHTHCEPVSNSQTQSAALSSASSKRDARHILGVGHWCTGISRESDIWEFTSEIPDPS